MEQEIQKIKKFLTDKGYSKEVFQIFKASNYYVVTFLPLGEMDNYAVVGFDGTIKDIPMSKLDRKGKVIYRK